jgi:hypothetical protein
LVMFAIAAPARALEPSELVGVWTTEWSNAADEAISGGGPMRVAIDSSEESLDGLIPGPGMDGVMNGEITAGENGAVVWSGVWVSYWPEGATRGTYRFVFTSADVFTGTWSTDDKEVQNAAWNGRRAE